MSTGPGPPWDDDTIAAQLAAARAAAEEETRGQERPGVVPGVRFRLGKYGDDLEPRTDWRLTAWLAGLLASAVAVVSGLGWAVQAAPGGEPVPSDQMPPAAVLTLLTDTKGAATAAALMSVSGDSASCLLAPRQLVLDVPGHGRLSLQKAAATTDDATTAAAVSDTLGVRVDDTWRLSGPGLKRLVDAVGGVEVDPDTSLTSVQTAAAESKELTGLQAARWTAKVPDGTQDTVRLARFHEVLDGVLERLPDDPVAREKALDAVYDDARTTLPRERFVQVLSQLHDATAQQRMADTVLPVVDTADGESVRYGVDRRKYGSLLDGPLAHVRMPSRPGGDLRVLVRTPPGNAPLATPARERLVAARLKFVNEPSPAAGSSSSEVTTMAAGAPTRTTISVPTSSEADQRKAEEVRKALGLPDAEILVAATTEALADVLVQLGEDFQEALARASASGSPSSGSPAPSPTAS